MSWEMTSLRQCTEYITDGDHQPVPKSERGIHFIKIKDIKNNKISFDDALYVPVDYYEHLAEDHKAKRYDILYTVVGSFGIPAFVDFDMPFCFERNIALLHPNRKIIPQFLYYVLKTDMFYQQALGVANGAAQKLIPLKKLKNLTFLLPPLITQQRIINILSAYDSLIENNQKQIKLLEEAAQRLYKEWFVDLRFPGYEDVAIIDGVPEGWSKKLIDNVIGKVARSKQIKTADYLSEGVIPVIDQSRGFIAGYTNDAEALVNMDCPVIVFGDHTRILKYIQFPFAKGADGTQLIISINENMPQSLLYCSLIAVDLSNYHYARHFKYLKAEPILVPTKGIADKFDCIVSPILQKTQKLRDMSYKAAQARDRLLPKLMSGELEV